MAQSKAHMEATTRYNKKAYDRIELKLRKDTDINGETIRVHAAARGESVNILASGTMFRSAGGTCRTSFGQIPLRKARPADTLFSELYHFPGKAVEMID